MAVFRAATLLCLTHLCLVLSGCAGPIKPITNGSQTDLPDPGSTVVVWGQHKGAVGEVVTILQKSGLRVVERSRLQQIFDEQKIRLTHSEDDDVQILKVGKLAGASSIVFVDTESSLGQLSQAFVNKYGGGSRSETVTNLSVSVRGVNVETGEVMWTGTAHYPQAINNPPAGVVYLTHSAIRRGFCPDGAWKNDDEGCDTTKAYGGGMLGFKTEGRDTPDGRQLIVTSVTPNSPAEQAGLMIGDFLVSCDGKSFQTWRDYRMTCKTEAGQPITLQVKRGGKLTTISATAVSRSEKKE